MGGCCSISWCSRPRARKGFCDGHYYRQRRGIDMDKAFIERTPSDKMPETCTLDGCDEPHRNRGLCSLHYHRKREGRPLLAPKQRRIPGVTKKRTNGYVMVYLPDHPDAHASGFIFEHRLVMEWVIGRRLLPTENVHHINGERGDNDPDNLELWVKAQPAGQRPDDLVEFAFSILDRYELAHLQRGAAADQYDVTTPVGEV